MKFYCMKCKKSVEAPASKHVTKSGRKFAVAKHSCGTEMWRVEGRA